MKGKVILALVVALLIVTMTATVAVAKPKLTFWNMPFNTQEVSPEYVKWWQETIAKECADFEADSYFGPGTYDSQRKSYIVQAKNGKPDVVEGLVEDLTAYTKQDLILDLTELFNN